MNPIQGLDKEFIVKWNFQIRDSLRDLNKVKQEINEEKIKNSWKVFNVFYLW